VHTSCRRFRTQPHRWRTCQAILATLAVLAFFGDVWRTGHLLLTPHVRCPYDGALVHEDELPPSALTLEARNSERAPLPVSAVPHHDHHDCDALGAVHRFSAIIVPGQRSVRRAEVSVLSSRLDPRHPVARSVLSYAPKLSPPV
jgi:hypothetical protein